MYVTRVTHMTKTIKDEYPLPELAEHPLPDHAGSSLLHIFDKQVKHTLRILTRAMGELILCMTKLQLNQYKVQTRFYAHNYSTVINSNSVHKLK